MQRVGLLLFIVLETESNLDVVALSSLAGVLFLFLVCFIVTYRVHRNNKRKEKLKISNENHRPPEQHTETYLRYRTS